MIVPLADETVRIEFLADARPWQPSERPVLVVAPHRDDETLGAGGLIAAQRSRGIEVRVVAVTDGEMAYGTRLAWANSGRRNKKTRLPSLAFKPMTSFDCGPGLIRAKFRGLLSER